jgi:hypothetical protein
MKVSNSSSGDYQSKPRKPAPAGPQFARGLHVIDLGTQEQIIKGQKDTKRKMLIFFELVLTNEQFRDNAAPEPFVVNKQYTVSLNEKATLHKDLSDWLGRKISKDEADAGYEFSERIGKPCIITITHTEKKGDPSTIYANVNTIIPPMAGTQELPMLRNQPIVFEIGMQNQFQVFKKLYNWVQKKIAVSPEFQAECAKYGVSAQQLMDEATAEWKAANGIQTGQQQQQQYQQPYPQQPQQQWQQPQQQQQWQQPAPQQPQWQQPMQGQPQKPHVQYPAAPNPQFQPPAPQPGYGQPGQPYPQQQPGYPQMQPPMQQQPYQQPGQQQQPMQQPYPQQQQQGTDIVTNFDEIHRDPF